MKLWYTVLIVVVLMILAMGAIILFVKKSAIQKLSLNQVIETQETVNKEGAMKLTSSAFENNQPIPAKYTCDGVNISPPLAISEVPVSAQSLVLIVDDPDAPAGDWVHWTVFDIDPKTTEITEGSVPSGASEGMTDFGKATWGGPCPPSGTHHYQFKLYSLDTKLDLGASARKIDLERAMQGHILDQTVLVGLYSRG